MASYILCVQNDVYFGMFLLYRIKHILLIPVRHLICLKFRFKGDIFRQNMQVAPRPFISCYTECCRNKVCRYEQILNK